jgi:hypothetical protein
MTPEDRLTTLGLLWAAWEQQGRVLGILEATVHLLDLQRALGVAPDVPYAGLEHTVEVLARMTPPVDFIELATGRRKIALFPVLR